MDRATNPGILFVIVGFLSGLVAIVGFVSEITSINTGQSEFAVSIIFISSFGFVLTGWRWLHDHPGATRVPSFALGTVGIISTVGGPVVFRPWAYGGIAGGLRTMITGALAVVGLGIVLCSVYWNAKRKYRLPLALLAGILAVGHFYLAHQVLDLAIGIPALGVLVGVTLIASIAVVFAWLETQPAEQ